MLNKELISASVPTLSPDDTILQALQLMGDYHISHLPVIDEEKYVGLVSEDELINAEQETGAIKTLQADFSKLSVNANRHVSEAVRLVNENAISLMPVTDNETNWVGAITLADLLKGMGKLNGVDEPGGIIVLEIDKKDFSFSQISKLVEANDAHIVQLNTTFDNALGTFLVTIKVNKLEVSAIVATFQRYDYVVKYYFGEELYENELKTNYDHLINYLNI